VDVYQEGLVGWACKEVSDEGRLMEFSVRMVMWEGFLRGSSVGGYREEGDMGRPLAGGGGGKG
jgi:hypothetical protein